eukprot:TRINITY_DN8449_c0_g1_i2.p1 TRINITY_DN8449_c0_g1~~TRINITY_DN8449_c0_g1_i2.p1  ORF type:complete len:400 (+),score=61.13 TRINITY_DN8449_c0_g1_i2:106-1305(+)
MVGRRKPPPGVAGLAPSPEEKKEVHFKSPNLVEVQTGKGEEVYSLSSQGLKGTHKFEDLILFEDSPIGSGSQAKVVLAQHKTTNEKFAMKQASFRQDMSTNGLRSDLAHVLSIEKHPNLVTSLDAYFREGYIMILMEYCSMGNLSKLLYSGPRSDLKIPMTVLSVITRQIVTGLRHLHKKGVIHRDMKPSNVLINQEGIVKICDFGVSKQITGNKLTHTAVGAKMYLSPERVRGEGYGQATDIWALGVTVAELALGEHPWEGKNDLTLADMLASCKVDVEWPATDEICPELKDFVAMCMVGPVDGRPTAESLLEHPFVKMGHENALTEWLSIRFPSVWKKAKDKQGRVFFLNSMTGEKAWLCPTSSPQWKIKINKEGSIVYVHSETGEKTPKKPSELTD